MYYFTQRKRRESASSSSSIKKVKKPWLFKLSWTSFGSILSDWLRGWLWLRSLFFWWPVSDTVTSSLSTTPQSHLPPSSLYSPDLHHDTDHLWHPILLYHHLWPTRQPEPKWTVNWQRDLIVTWKDRSKEREKICLSDINVCMTKWIWMPLETGIKGCLLFLWLPPGNGRLWKSVYLYICHSGFYQQSCSYRDWITLSYKSLSFGSAHSAHHL